MPYSCFKGGSDRPFFFLVTLSGLILAISGLLVSILVVGVLLLPGLKIKLTLNNMQNVVVVMVLSMMF